eukprot:11161956-Lingulodinium_polyedra.AAC.1
MLLSGSGVVLKSIQLLFKRVPDTYSNSCSAREAADPQALPQADLCCEGLVDHCHDQALEGLPEV